MIIGYLLILHFISDFVLQSRRVAVEKSTRFNVLLEHLGVIGLVFAIGMAPFTINGMLKPVETLSFAGLNILAHGLIDWNIWRIYKKFTAWQIAKGNREDLLPSDTYEYWKDHYFYLTIGFDQLLHALTLVLLLKLYIN